MSFPKSEPALFAVARQYYREKCAKVKLYRVEVKSTVVETYHIYAENADEAMESWSDGKFIETGDRIDAEPVAVVEIPEK